MDILHLLYGINIDPRPLSTPYVQQEDYTRGEYGHLRNKQISIQLDSVVSRSDYY